MAFPASSPASPRGPASPTPGASAPASAGVPRGLVMASWLDTIRVAHARHAAREGRDAPPMWTFEAPIVQAARRLSSLFAREERTDAVLAAALWLAIKLVGTKAGKPRMARHMQQVTGVDSSRITEAEWELCERARWNLMPIAMPDLVEVDLTGDTEISYEYVDLTSDFS